jgi:hypothetical protein
MMMMMKTVRPGGRNERIRVVLFEKEPEWVLESRPTDGQSAAWSGGPAEIR